MGKVYLIGAGPGDEDLITIKAIKAISKSSVVLYDRLAGEKYLKYVEEDSKIVYCGKKPGSHSKTQEEINSLLIKFAKEGHIVARIKGGDPYVFGRGSEEALALKKEGIEFEIIPGITSAISVLNYAGIPATHRGLSQSFHVFTGTSANKLNINWESVSKLEGTLIFLMGLKNIEDIIENLIQNGKDKNTPCAVITQGTTSRQKKVIATLSNISDKVRKENFKSPCIIVVGDVVLLSEKLDWYENKPLFGINICITRTKKQSDSIRNRLLDLGAEVTQINSIKIKPTPKKLDIYAKSLDKYDFILFTSVNAVDIFFKYLIENNIDIRSIKAQIAVIGPATEKAVKKFAVIPVVVAKEFIAEGLYKDVKGHIKNNNKVLIPTSSLARDYLEDKLVPQGAKVDRVNIYDVDIGEELEDFSKSDIVLFTSPSTVKNMIKLVGLESIKDKKVISIGPITSKELIKNNINYVECDKYNEDGIIDKLISLKSKGEI